MRNTFHRRTQNVQLSVERRIMGKVQATLFKCSLSICTYQHCHYPATTAGVSFVSNPSNRSRQVAKPSLAIDQVPALPGVAPPLSLPPLYILLTDAGFALTQPAMFSQLDLSDFLNLTPFPVHRNQSHYKRQIPRVLPQIVSQHLWMVVTKRRCKQASTLAA